MERTTEQARAAIARGERHAVELGHPEVGPEHLLLGLASRAGGVAADALLAAGFDHGAAVAALGALAGPSESVQPTAAYQRTLAVARQFSEVFNEPEVDTNHLLLAVVNDPPPTVARLLDAMRTTPAEIHRHTVRAQLRRITRDLAGSAPAALPGRWGALVFCVVLTALCGGLGAVLALHAPSRDQGTVVSAGLTILAGVAVLLVFVRWRGWARIRARAGEATPTDVLAPVLDRAGIRGCRLRVFTTVGASGYAHRWLRHGELGVNSTALGRGMPFLLAHLLGKLLHRDHLRDGVARALVSALWIELLFAFEVDPFGPALPAVPALLLLRPALNWWDTLVSDRVAARWTGRRELLASMRRSAEDVALLRSQPGGRLRVLRLRTVLPPVALRRWWADRTRNLPA